MDFFDPGNDRSNFYPSSSQLLHGAGPREAVCALEVSSAPAPTFYEVPPEEQFNDHPSSDQINFRIAYIEADRAIRALHLALPSPEADTLRNQITNGRVPTYDEILSLTTVCGIGSYYFWFGAKGATYFCI